MRKVNKIAGDIYLQRCFGKVKTEPPLVGTKENPVYFLGFGTVKGGELTVEVTEPAMQWQPTFFREFQGKLLYIYAGNSKLYIFSRIRMTEMSIEHPFITHIKFQRE